MRYNNTYNAFKIINNYYDTPLNLKKIGTA